LDEAFVLAWGGRQSPNGSSGAISITDILRVRSGRVFKDSCHCTGKNARLHLATKRKAAYWTVASKSRLLVPGSYAKTRAQWWDAEAEP
jgi:hypothetical protein